MDPESHCLLCDRPDTVDNLVQCDQCDGYVHFSCAEVGESIADVERSFTCRKCAENEVILTISSHRSSRRTHTSSGSSVGALRLQLRLQQIEADQQNRLKELEDAEKFQRLRRQVEADVEKQRFEALEAQLEEEEHRSVRSGVSSSIIREITGKWIGAACQTGGQEVTTSTAAVATTTSTDAILRNQPGTQSGSRRQTPSGSVVAEVVRSSQPGEVATTTTSESVVLQQGSLIAKSTGILAPVQTSASNVTSQQGPVVPASSGSQKAVSEPSAIGKAVYVTGGKRTGAVNPAIISNNVVTPVQTQRVPQPAVGAQSDSDLVYRETCMGRTTIHHGIPIGKDQSAESQVRSSYSNIKVGLQPVGEVVQTRAPNRNQLGFTSRHEKQISQSQISQPPLPQAKPDEGEPPPGSSLPLPELLPGNRQTQSNSSGLVPPPGHEQFSASNTSMPLPPSGHEQFYESNPSEPLPPPGHEQCDVSNASVNLPPSGDKRATVPKLQSSMQQGRLDLHTQWNESVQQPSGYESFMGESAMPLPRSTDLGGTCSNAQLPPASQKQNFEPNARSSGPYQGAVPKFQQKQGTNLLRLQPQSEVPKSNSYQIGYQHLESEPSSVPQPGNRHLEENLLQSELPFRTSNPSVLLPSSGQQQYQVPTSSVIVPSSGHQQFQVPPSSVLVPPPGHQQYRVPNLRAPEPPPGPEQPFVPGNQNVRPVPVQQNIPDPVRPRCATGPTTEQLAARQVIPRELPVFSGDPQDWPLFFSSFRNSTEACGYNDAENLARLQRCLRGNALDSVRTRLLIPESVPHVMATLERLYGRPEVIILALLRRMREIPSPRGDDLKTLIKFGMGVEHLVEHMILADQQQHINNPMLLHELVDRLPTNLKMQWASYKRSYYQVNLATFNDFMKDLVTMASDVTLHVDPGMQSLGKNEKSKREKPAKEKLFVHQQASTAPVVPAESSTSQQEVVSPVNKSCLYCDKPDHRIAECPGFKKLNMDERWKVMRQKKLCRLCLVPHRSWPCRSKQECGVGDCRMRHHSLLHSRKPEANAPAPSASTNQNVAHQHHHSQTSSALLRYLPVTLHGNGKTVDIYAFLDDGSTSTMLEAKIANLLGVTGPSEPLCLCWTGDVKRIEKGSRRIEISVSGRRNEKSFPLKARTVEQLKLPSQTVNYEELCEVHPCLKKLPLQGYADVTPRLIIGVDNARLISALKSRESGTGELVAAKTRLGWCVYGRSTTGTSLVEYVNAHVEDCEKEADLHDLFRRFLAVDEASIKASPQSEEDKRALKILQETTRRVDGRLETGLLWRCDEPCLPNSYPMAVRRMESLERKLSKDPDLDANVRKQIAEYLEKGYAHRITAEEWESTEPGRVWYLPLGVVRNPNKPGKVRLIWDAAARVNGVSFNDMMLKGPDMLTALTTVLLRFRQKRIAFSGDIKEMFHQFLIRLRDKQAQRFIFREWPGQPPQIFVMDVATFGAACSPCIAQYLKNRNAEEYVDEFPDAAKAIIENHYVDDYLDSVATVDEAVERINEVKHVHSKAGMEIRNFSSNSAEVLERVGETSKVQQKSLNLESGVERVLGMVWKPSEDVFSFEISLKEEIRKIVDSQEAPTKRQVLRTIMSLFDPLGLVAHFSVHGKILMQRIWRTGSGWDVPIEGEILEDWRQWIGLLVKINEVSVPRCFFAGTGATSEDSQIHVFVDASENAYACVVYLRSMCNGSPRCTLIAAKTKVAPLKPLSIPRLELQAALIGARLLDSICKALTIPVAARFLWSDSTTVLAWLKSENRRYHQFVGFRVGEIISTTTVDEWRKVQSKVNVADQATKWRDGPSFRPDDWWYAGPSFLMEPDANWRTENSKEYSTTEELRAIFLHHRVMPPPIVDVQRFSKWSRLLRAVGYVIRATKVFLGLDAEGPLTQEELLKAETVIWQLVQKQEYPDEYVKLSHNIEHPDAEPKQIAKSSALYQLSPMMDDDGVLRMNSRIVAAPLVSRDLRYPIILPKGHRVTQLLVESYHVHFLHGNNESVVNEMRQRFRIPELRRVVAKIAKRCQHCRIQKAVPQVPIMAPLPELRLTAFVRPFTHTGVDYFGPVFVKQGRSLVKRWVALFTCLSIRAVHLENVHSLSTQSCVMAIRRFVARRGSPATFCSDNGTCFVGANNLLREQLKAINEDCAASITNADTRWLFNPPLAPHMGGSWERMVRSVKAAMSAIADYPHHPNDEVLETVVLEAESIINSRPLTYIPLDHAEQEALTPNHFLLYGTQGVNQPSRDLEQDYATLRDSWKLAQYLVDMFWSRWVREYLPTLTRRTKWFQPVKPLKSGDLVVVVDEGKRNGWLRGRIREVVPGKDGQVRRAVVSTARGVISRPATKLALLDVRGTSGEPEDGCSSEPELHGRGDVGEPTVQALPVDK